MEEPPFPNDHRIAVHESKLASKWSERDVLPGDITRRLSYI
jgi:hypothetical protein